MTVSAWSFMCDSCIIIDCVPFYSTTHIYFSCSLTPTVSKASAGAMEWMPVYSITGSMVRFLKVCHCSPVLFLLFYESPTLCVSRLKRECANGLSRVKLSNNFAFFLSIFTSLWCGNVVWYGLMFLVVLVLRLSSHFIALSGEWMDSLCRSSRGWRKCPRLCCDRTHRLGHG